MAALTTCIDHLDFAGETCEDCGLQVNEFGNTEEKIEYCQFPHCGCNGARCCMAEQGPNDHASRGNVEGMWSSGSEKRCREAAFYTIGLLDKEQKL